MAPLRGLVGPRYGHVMATVFYSWQSQLEAKRNRNLIENALEKAARRVASDKSSSYEPIIDRDTKGVAGSPDIFQAILEKIDRADVFVADISIVNENTGARSAPNANVLVELGYALKALGSPRIILVMNSAHGGPENLPFDLQKKRVMTYACGPDAEVPEARASLVTKLEAALRAVLDEQGLRGDLKPPVDLWETHAIRSHALRAGMTAEKRNLGLMQVAFQLQPRRRPTTPELLQAVTNATVSWNERFPVRFFAQEDGARARTDGVEFEVGQERTSSFYGLWRAWTDGAFFSADSLLEDASSGTERCLNVEVAVQRLAIRLGFALQLAKELDCADDFLFGVHFEGLSGRRLTSGYEQMGILLRIQPRKCEEPSYRVQEHLSVRAVTDDPYDVVRQLLAPLFHQFGFWEMPAMDRPFREAWSAVRR